MKIYLNCQPIKVNKALFKAKKTDDKTLFKRTGHIRSKELKNDTKIN